MTIDVTSEAVGQALLDYGIAIHEADRNYIDRPADLDLGQAIASREARIFEARRNLLQSVVPGLTYPEQSPVS
jgi:hypothetical protein